MATVKNIETHRNWGVRPNDNVIHGGMVWRVKKGEPYDLVQFSINELNKGYYWADSLCLPAGLPDDEIKAKVEAYAKKIPTESISRFKEFLEDGEKWGWD